MEEGAESFLTGVEGTLNTSDSIDFFLGTSALVGDSSLLHTGSISLLWGRWT